MSDTQIQGSITVDKYSHLPIDVQQTVRELERENAALRTALALGQQNCDTEYDRLRKERDANKTALAATHSQLVALREDKVRLDWMDANCEVIVSTAVKGDDLFGHNAHLNTNHLGNLRLAIDAARKEAQP